LKQRCGFFSRLPSHFSRSFHLPVVGEDRGKAGGWPRESHIREFGNSVRGMGFVLVPHCEFVAILYGSTPTIISLRPVSGSRRPRGFDRDTMQGALSVPVVDQRRSQRLPDLELWDFSYFLGASAARAVFLSRRGPRCLVQRVCLKVFWLVGKIWRCLGVALDLCEIRASLRRGLTFSASFISVDSPPPL